MFKSKYGIDIHGIEPTRGVYWNFPVPWLIERAVDRREGLLTDMGAFSVLTGKRTGRSPRDKFIIREPVTEKAVAWGKINAAMSPEQFENLYPQTVKHLNTQDLFVVDAWAGADPAYGLPIRVITTKAWHALFAHQLLRRQADTRILAETKPEFTILAAPDCLADPASDGTSSEAYILLNFARRMVLIGGTHYAGEIKKSVFTIMNFLLPDRGVFPMHCSANVGNDGDVALFFGLSGTGKTTLSADPRRRLIGDDEHGWSDSGIFNFEGRLLREVHQPVRGARAADLPRPEIRGRAGERGGRLGDAGCRFRQRQLHGEPPRGVSGRVYPERPC